jgi:hypothetical protein
VKSKPGEKSEGPVGKIVVAVVIALLVGGSSPWWWNKLFPLLRSLESKRKIAEDLQKLGGE